jgi:hypothetical protein
MLPACFTIYVHSTFFKRYPYKYYGSSVLRLTDITRRRVGTCIVCSTAVVGVVVATQW